MSLFTREQRRYQVTSEEAWEQIHSDLDALLKGTVDRTTLTIDIFRRGLLAEAIEAYQDDPEYQLIGVEIALSELRMAIEHLEKALKGADAK